MAPMNLPPHKPDLCALTSCAVPQCLPECNAGSLALPGVSGLQGVSVQCWLLPGDSFFSWLEWYQTLSPGNTIRAQHISSVFGQHGYAINESLAIPGRFLCLNDVTFWSLATSRLVDVGSCVLPTMPPSSPHADFPHHHWRLATCSLRYCRLDGTHISETHPAWMGLQCRGHVNVRPLSQQPVHMTLVAD